MKKLLIVVFGLLCGTAVAAEKMIRLVPIGATVKNVHIPEANLSVEDGFLVSVFVFNDSANPITLPSKMLHREIVERDDTVLVLFSYSPDTFASKSGRRPVIPSREAFAPITLQTGECMQLEPFRFAVERKDTKSKPVIYMLRTKGFLAVRMGFTEVDLQSELIMPNYEISPDLREP